MRACGLFITAAALLPTWTTADRLGGRSIEEVAYSIADPTSDDFRNFLSQQEATELLKQIPEITFATPSKRSIVDGAALHAHSAKAIQRAAVEQRDTCGKDDIVTPTCIRQVYDIDAVAEPSRVTFAVYATEGGSFNQADVDGFLSQFRPEATGAAYTVIGTGNPAIPTGIEGQFEVALDTQTLLGTAWNAEAVLYNLGGVFGPNPGKPYKPFVDFLHGLILNDTAPSVVSFSQSLPEDTIEPQYAQTLCLTMALVGARGISLLFSSGNNGPNGESASGEHKAVFEPKFPASCPWVTAVGGTTNLAVETGATSQTIPAFDATFYTASGGGFSNLFSQPVYQHVVVPEYVDKHVPQTYYNASGFNAKGRGIPDVSAFSTNMPTVVNGATLPLGGTSAATPLWAAVVTLLNDHEVSQGRPVLGFLNPWLYSLSTSSTGDSPLKDITTGGNSKGGCNALAGCNLTQVLGFDVTESWDPVTGLGSPSYQQLVQALEENALGCT